MVSGKYSALSGAISREQRLANIGTNLANVNTVGYKKSRMSFESLLRGEQQVTTGKGINMSRVRENFTEFTPGAIRNTSNPLDISINSEGFFKVQSEDGFKYTRRGDFHLDQDGILLTGNNLPVLDDGNAPIQIPDSDTARISINSYGEVSIMAMDGSKETVGTIAIYNVNDTKLLKRESETLYSLTDGGQEIISDEPKLNSESLEISNVNMTEEMALMIESGRTFESYQKVIKAYSTLGQKLDELGTVG